MTTRLRCIAAAALAAATLGAAAPASADRLHMRDGRVLSGHFLGATASTIHMRVAERLRRVPVDEVASVELDEQRPAQRPAAAERDREDARVVIVGTGPAQAIEREPAAR